MRIHLLALFLVSWVWNEANYWLFTYVQINEVPISSSSFVQESKRAFSTLSK